MAWYGNGEGEREGRLTTFDTTVHSSVLILWSMAYGQNSHELKMYNIQYFSLARACLFVPISRFFGPISSLVRSAPIYMEIVSLRHPWENTTSICDYRSEALTK